MKKKTFKSLQVGSKVTPRTFKAMCERYSRYYSVFLINNNKKSTLVNDFHTFGGTEFEVLDMSKSKHDGLTRVKVGNGD